MQEKLKLIEKTEEASKIEQAVRGQILNLQCSMVQLESQSKNKRQQASQLFENIRKKCLEREAAVFQQISDDLEKETFTHKNQVLLLERQLKCIEDMIIERSQLYANEPGIETLANADMRN
jgi:hypothetical protein